MHRPQFEPEQRSSGVTGPLRSQEKPSPHGLGFFHSFSFTNPFIFFETFMKIITAETLADCPHWSRWFADHALRSILAHALEDRDWTTIWLHMEPLVGLEMHIGLKSQTKLFSAAPKGQAGWLDMGYPGALPLLDSAAVECAVRVGKSVGAQFAPTMFFERKRYAYPDLSKGYQTTQKTSPVWSGGQLQCEWGFLPLIRAQLEEDAASVERHPEGFRMDFARAGSPLLEVVTDVAELTRERLVQSLRTLYRQALILGATEGKIEEGQMKSDINLSLRPRGSQHFSERWEIKGVSSFELAGLAFDDAMAQRLALLLDSTKPMEARLGKATTLGFSEDTGHCYAMREKLSEHQYRFLPCPDLGEIDVPTVSAPAYGYIPTIQWLERICGSEFAGQRWQSVLEHRTVLGFFGSRTESDAPPPALLWTTLTWLMDHPGAALLDLWCALRASPDARALKAALSVLDQGPWSDDAFAKALQGASAQLDQWGAAQSFLEDAFAQRLSTDPKFAAAIAEVQAGKQKAIGYVQGQLMGALRKEGHPAIGDLLTPWLIEKIQRIQTIQSSKEAS